MAMGKVAFRRILPSALSHWPRHPPSPGEAAVVADWASAGVSPERTATVMSGFGSPNRTAS